MAYFANDCGLTPLVIITSFLSVESEQGLHCPLTKSEATVEYIEAKQSP